jgi:hypothetical protein
MGFTDSGSNLPNWLEHGGAICGRIQHNPELIENSCCGKLHGDEFIQKQGLAETQCNSSSSNCLSSICKYIYPVLLHDINKDYDSSLHLGQHNHSCSFLRKGS